MRSMNGCFGLPCGAAGKAAEGHRRRRADAKGVKISHERVVGVLRATGARGERHAFHEAAALRVIAKSSSFSAWPDRFCPPLPGLTGTVAGLRRRHRLLGRVRRQAKYVPSAGSPPPSPKSGARSYSYSRPPASISTSRMMTSE